MKSPATRGVKRVKHENAAAVKRYIPTDDIRVGQQLPPVDFLARWF